VRERFTGVSENLESARTEMRLEIVQDEGLEQMGDAIRRDRSSLDDNQRKAHNLKPKASMLRKTRQQQEHQPPL